MCVNAKERERFSTICLIPRRPLNHLCLCTLADSQVTQTGKDINYKNTAGIDLCLQYFVHRGKQKGLCLNLYKMGKKRNVQPPPAPVPTRIKVEIKDELADSDVLVARDRLKGALRELLQDNDTGSSAESSEESSTQDYKHQVKRMDSTYKSKSMNQPRRIRRRRQVQTDTSFHHTYVMKLFDRSVDLAQFQEDTPLYPICRAWMANQPRNPNLVPKVRSPSPEIVNEINVNNDILDSNGEIRDVYYLPAPLPREEAIPRNRIPSPIRKEKEELNLDYDGQTLKSRDTLLREHTIHWNAVRKKWHQQAHKNEQRFVESTNILNTIYKRAQSEYE